MIAETELARLLMTVVFAFLIGLEMKKYRQTYHAKSKEVIGTARTYTFLGIIGYLFYRIDDHALVYIAGFAGFTVLYALFYARRLSEQHYSILGYLVGCVVYSLGPLAVHFPFWMPALVFVIVIFTLNARSWINDVTQTISGGELETLGKMVLLSAVILPLLPNEKVIPYLPLSPYKIWLAVVVISAISYGGYLAQRYFFPGKGLFLTGIIGGTYSSTATTVVLAKKARHLQDRALVTSSIVAATSMMYLRLIVVAAVFNLGIAESVALPLGGFAVMSLVIAALYYKAGASEKNTVETDDANPLELGTAFVFAALFVVMIAVTQFVTQHYGSAGLKVLSFAVGFTDIDPFILSLLTGKYSVTHQEIYAAILIAAGSNNLLKALYALWFGKWKMSAPAFVWLGILGIATIAAGLFLPAVAAVSIHP